MGPRWGILGTGKIARAFAGSLAGASGAGAGRVSAVASRSAAGAEAFGDDFRVPRRHASYEELVHDAEVDVVYVATPHPTHARWAVAAAQAGKHVLCEKPLTMNHREALDVVDAAQRAGTFLMEAFAYRCHPQTARLLGLLREGAIGELRMIEAAFGYDAGPAPANYLLQRDLGGGSILDVGCYTISMARLVAGAAAGEEFADPLEVAGGGRLDPSGVDHYASASLTFDSGVVATVSCAVQVDLDSSLRIFGSEGRITVAAPWLPGRIPPAPVIRMQRRGEAATEIPTSGGEDLYASEAATVAAALPGTESPAMTWEDTLGNMATLDRWRDAVGVQYAADDHWGTRAHDR